MLNGTANAPATIGAVLGEIRGRWTGNQRYHTLLEPLA